MTQAIHTTAPTDVCDDGNQTALPSTTNAQVEAAAERIGNMAHYIERLALMGEGDPDDAPAILGALQSVAREIKADANNIQDTASAGADSRVMGLFRDPGSN